MRIPDAFNTIVRLRFEDPRLAGLDVRIRRTWGLVDSGADLSTIDADAFQAGSPAPEDLAKVRQVVDDFAGALVSWNLTDDDDQPIPTDRETVRGLDFMLVLMLVSSFWQAVSQLRAEVAQLARQQVSEADLPMEPADT